MDRETISRPSSLEEKCPVPKIVLFFALYNPARICVSDHIQILRNSVVITVVPFGTLYPQISVSVTA